MKPVYFFAPYWMGEYSPSQGGAIRHSWSPLPPAELDGSPTKRLGLLWAALANVTF